MDREKRGAHREQKRTCLSASGSRKAENIAPRQNRLEGRRLDRRGLGPAQASEVALEGWRNVNCTHVRRQRYANRTDDSGRPKKSKRNRHRNLTKASRKSVRSDRTIDR